MAASWNPLRCDRTPLPPQLLLLAKLAALCLLLNGEVVPSLASPGAKSAWAAVFLLGTVLLLLNRLPRAASLAAGAAALFGFSTPSLYPGCLLAAAALYRPGPLERCQRALRPIYPRFLWGGLLLYTVLLWVAGRKLGPIDAAVLSAYLAFAEWPRGRTLVIYDGACRFCNWTKKWMERLDWAAAFEWLPRQAPRAQALGFSADALEARLHVVAGDRAWTGFAAFRTMVLYNPLAYFAALGVLMVAGNWLMTGLLVLFAPFLTPVGETVYDWVARNRYRIPPRTCRALLAAALLALPARAATVIVVTDDPKPMTVLASFLAKNGQSVEILDQGSFASRRGSRSDAIIQYVHEGLDAGVESALIAYARGGGRLLILHHGIASAKMRAKQWLPFVGITLMPRDSLEYPWRVVWADLEIVNLRPGHYITSHNVAWDRSTPYTPSDGPSAEQQLPSILLPDTEGYLNQLFSDGRGKTVLLGFKCRAEGATHMQDRAGWYMPAGKGWLVYFQPGHHPRDFDHPAFRQMILNSLTWRPAAE